jgi:hypothetical protein
MEYAIMKQKMFPGPTPLPPLLRPHGLHGLIEDGVSIVTHESRPDLSIPIPSAMEYAIMKQKMFPFSTPSVW